MSRSFVVENSRKGNPPIYALLTVSRYIRYRYLLVSIFIVAGHTRAESVRLWVCMYHQNGVHVLATSQFQYVYGSAHYLAEYLIQSVHQPQALERLDAIRSENFNLAEESLSTLDDRLSSAFAHIGVAADWNVLGNDGYSPGESDVYIA